MQKTTHNGDNKQIRRNQNGITSKKKRSISVRERSDLIEYYHHQKVSEYSQQSLQPQEAGDHIQQNITLPLLKANKEINQQNQKSLVNATLKKQLNLLGIGEDSDRVLPIRDNNNDYAQRPFSSKYYNNIGQKNKQNFAQLAQQQYEFRNTKSTTRIMNQSLDQISSSIDNLRLLPSAFRAVNYTSNVLSYPNTFLKKEDFTLSKSSMNTTKCNISQIGGCQQNKILKDETKQYDDQQQLLPPNCFNAQYIFNVGEYINESRMNKSKDYLHNQQDYVLIERENKINQNDEIKSNQLHIPLQIYSQRMSSSPVNSGQKRKKIDQIQNSYSQTSNGNNFKSGSEYTKFQNQLLNILLPQPTEEDKQNLQNQKEKEGTLKYFNFPRNYNLRENKINKLKQSKQIFQAYLSQRSPKQVSEQMNDPSVLSTLHMVKNNIKSSHKSTHRHSQSKKLYSQHHSSNYLSALPIKEKQIITNEGSISKCKLTSQNQIPQLSEIVNYQIPYQDSQTLNKSERLPFQYSQALNEFDNKDCQNQDYQQSYKLEQQKVDKDITDKDCQTYIKFEQRFDEDNQESDNEQQQQNSCKDNSLNIKNNVNIKSNKFHFVEFNRSRSVDRGSLVKQIKREQFNNQFNVEMMKIRTRERQIREQPHTPIQSNDTSQLSTNLNIPNQLRKGSFNEQSVMKSDKSKQVYPKVNPLLSKRLVNSQNKLNQLNRQTKHYLHQRSQIQRENAVDINLPLLENIRIFSTERFQERKSLTFNDQMLNTDQQLRKEMISENQLANQNKLSNEQLLSFLDNCHTDSQFSFSERSKENLNNHTQYKKQKRNSSKKKKQKYQLNDINRLFNILNKEKKIQQSHSKEKLDNSFESYQPSNNHLKNSKKLYQKSKYL